MNLRHAAALALVVYLLVPPFKDDPNSQACAAGTNAACLRQTLNPSAPIGSWRALQAFETAEACNAFRSDRIRLFQKCQGSAQAADASCPGSQELTRFNLDMVQQGRCIPLDDLRQMLK
ncbi:MAG TPA: hypothetical protein VKT27_15765 [Candidatus Binataceae bacterium]|nr:hypothetical protein [Candidatus Binataceae bacterium]